ncbi:unnamed protein product [Cuscuta campestris]|uniref:Uncharacterized protein n=1 Tax=Cuscuta campestris TaxID=132261 RepID=A0A484NE52_9ASTE|nr:unnamed protein product [Cuscuta campestris]
MKKAVMKIAFRFTPSTSYGLRELVISTDGGGGEAIASEITDGIRRCAPGNGITRSDLVPNSTLGKTDSERLSIRRI